MANWRLFPPLTAPQQTIAHHSGRTYTQTPGSFLDVNEHDSLTLVANGWIKVAEVGTTAQRPTQLAPSLPLPPGYKYVDTTISKIVTWDGKTWRDYAGVSA